MVAINSKMLESQNEQSEMRLHKLSMSKIQFWGMLHSFYIKMSCAQFTTENDV